MKGILCFGDSITFGRGETPNKSWSGRLKEYFESKDFHNGVYNLGVPGHTSTDLLERFDSEAFGRIRTHRLGNEYLILIAIGTNDCKLDLISEGSKPRITIEKFRENIKELIKKAKCYKAKLVFLGLPPVDEARTLPYEETSFTNKRVKKFNDVVKESCEAAEVSFLDIFEIMIKENYQELLKDGLHPNSKGYDFMFNIIKTFLEKNKLI
jgi:acyl-CoA thioesterase I